MRFKRSFGQVFLRDKTYIKKIVHHLKSDNEVILEIGPGSGVVTRRLLERCKKLYCVEKDLSLVRLLEERFTSEGVVVIYDDILKFNLSSLNTQVLVFGNVPFNISNRLMQYLVRNKLWVKQAYLTFQKEFARKLVAGPNTKEYGFISCYFQYYTSMRVLFDIPKGAFYPKPEVDASFMEIVFQESPFKIKDEVFLFKLIKRSFALRRKKLFNALEGFCNKEVIKRTFLDLGLDLGVRAENLALKEYCFLADSILASQKVIDTKQEK